jgi:hypothetical protein
MKKSTGDLTREWLKEQKTTIKAFEGLLKKDDGIGREFYVSRLAVLNHDVPVVESLVDRLENKALRVGDEDASDLIAEIKRYTGGTNGLAKVAAF